MYFTWLIIAALLVAVLCSFIGCFLILRKQALMADAISHTILLGIVLAFLVSSSLDGIAMLIGGSIAGLFTAALTQWIQYRGIKNDAAIGIVFTTLFAIAVVIISMKTSHVHIDVNHTIMGEMAFIPWEKVSVLGLIELPRAIVLLTITSIVVAIVCFGLYEKWKLLMFDEHYAKAIGIKAGLYNYLFMLLLSLVAVAAFDAVGSILVIALLITPAATAYLWTNKLKTMIILSVIIGAVSALVGLLLAWQWDTTMSGMIALTTGFIFMVSFMVTKFKRIVI